MKLVSATIKDYRSITQAYKIPIGRRTVLIGANNEGKSNVLGALVLGMLVLRTFAERYDPERPTSILPLSRVQLYARRRRLNFDWERDFPIQLQRALERAPASKRKATEITLEFELDSQELESFEEAIESRLNGSLPIRMLLDNVSVRIEVVKQGKGSRALNAKASKVARFVADRIELEHIPAVRTADAAREVVESLIERELSVLEGDKSYQEALKRITDLQEPILARLADTITTTLKKFLRNINSVELRIQETTRRSLRRSCEIWIDDGLQTPLEQKGDGVKSLAALALMKQASETQSGSKQLIVAIEEPESHLHPAAIHELRSVVSELSETNQIVITTHNPLFVDRVAVKNNVVVSRNKASVAAGIPQLRKILGVRASDNLQHAGLVVVVEGETDKRTLMSVLRHYYPIVARALADGLVAIDALGGGGKLGYKVGLITSSICSVHCFLDHDAAGIAAFEQAKKEDALTDAEATFAIALGRREGELEDLISVKCYQESVLKRFGVDLSGPLFSRGREKWTSRVRKAFEKSGRLWSDSIEKQVKECVCEGVEAVAGAALIEPLRGPIDNLASSIERHLRDAGE